MGTFQLYMGRNMPDGGYVDDAEWFKFLHLVDTIVDGYTVQDVDGVWLGEHEDCKLMTISTDDIDNVYDIARTYKRAFKQIAVGMQVLPSMEFV